MEAVSRIAVLGDAMVDVYVEGTVDRVCPEAPVPVFLRRRTWSVPGGASNVMAHLVALGHEVSLFTSPRPVTKTRYVDPSGHLLLRVDDEPDCKVEPDWMERLARESWDALVVSDYGKGAVRPFAVDWEPPALTIVDSKGGWHRFAGVDCLCKGNAHAHVPEREGAVQTLGPLGARYFEGSAWHMVYAPEVNVVDVTGAGDTVTAHLTDRLLKGDTLRAALEVAVAKGSEACTKRGTAVVV